MAGPLLVASVIGFQGWGRSESPHEGKYECSTESGCQNARNRAGKIFNAGKRVSPVAGNDRISAIKELHDDADGHKANNASYRTVN